LLVHIQIFFNEILHLIGYGFCHCKDEKKNDLEKFFFRKCFSLSIKKIQYLCSFLSNSFSILIIIIKINQL